jgi:MoCo/4Fe-4S cofactor protein with predicted Tat translocation signal
MSDKKYWQSFAELNDKGEFQKRNNNEFKEELPFEDIDGKGWLDAKAPRRDFLKYLGFSTAAARLQPAAKCLCAKQFLMLTARKMLRQVLLNIMLPPMYRTAMYYLL